MQWAEMALFSHYDYHDGDYSDFDGSDLDYFNNTDCFRFQKN